MESATFGLLLVGLFWAPFWLGSNRVLPWSINAILFPSILFWFETALLLRAARHPVSIKTIGWQSLLFAIVVCWIALQMIATANLPLAFPIWGLASEALGETSRQSISLNADMTALALMRLLTEAAVFWLGLQLCRNERRAAALVTAIVVIGTIYAVWGLLAFATSPGRVLWLDNSLMKSNLTSSFVNRNSYATYAGLGLVCAIGSLISLYREEMSDAPGGTFRRLATLIDVSGGRCAPLLAACSILLAALLATSSRGGILSTIFGVLVLSSLMSNCLREGTRVGREIVLAVLMLGSVGFILFGDLFLHRIGQGGFADEGRVALYRITLEMIKNAPVVGYGYGTFSDVFPMFRDQSISPVHIWDKAHSTYVEVIVGLGLIGGFMLIISIAGLAFRCLLGAKRRRRSAVIPTLGFSAATIVGLHAFVDFSLQIQAVTITFAALLGAGCAQSESARNNVCD